MLGLSLLFFCLIVTCTSHPWHRIDSTKEVVGSNEVDPWDLEPQSIVYYDEPSEKPVISERNFRFRYQYRNRFVSFETVDISVPNAHFFIVFTTGNSKLNENCILVSIDNLSGHFICRKTIIIVFNLTI
jgi:hypothetical protein